MSPLARIFAFINVVLALVFLGSSAVIFMTRVNYRDMAYKFRDEAKVKLDKLSEDIKTQGAHLVQLSKQHSTLETLHAQLVADKDKLNSTLITKEQAINNLNSLLESSNKEKTQQLSNLETLQKQKAKVDETLDGARKDAEDAKTKAELAVNDMTRIRLDLDRLNEEHSKQLIANKDLTERYDSLRMIVDHLESVGIKVDQKAITAPLDAVVQAVKAQDKLVVLSVGRDQKVQEGFEFTVYRGDRFIGKVRVIKVYDDLAGARILFTSEKESIQVGDQASTQI